MLAADAIRVAFPPTADLVSVRSRLRTAECPVVADVQGTAFDHCRFLTGRLSYTPMETYVLDPPADVTRRLDDLLATPKFAPDGMLYTGVADPGARKAAETIVNAAITEVRELLRAPTDNAAVLKVFQAALRRLVLTDTEDRERAASHFEEIMDCIGLESSHGLLNEFVYGFDVSDLAS
jgi:hypothetical protein